jgi:hypothetical protein
MTGVARFERFFRMAAGLDVDKSDIKRHNEFITQKIDDLLIIGRAHANAEGRDVIEPHDLPITKGLQESIHKFRKLEAEVELEPLLERATVWPADIEPSQATEDKLPEVAGGLSYALAQSFRIIDPEVKNPSSEHWERAFRIFELLL